MLTIGLNLWYNAVARPETIESYRWLWRLQQPGAEAGEGLFRFLYPRLGNPWSLRCGVACAYGVLVILWTLAILATIGLKRLIATIHRGVGQTGVGSKFP